MHEQEFTDMIKAVREAESAIGKVDFKLIDKQLAARDYCRSLYVVKDILAGEELTNENIRSIRPGFGIHAKHFKKIIGKKASHSIEKGTRLSFDLIA